MNKKKVGVIVAEAILIIAVIALGIYNGVSRTTEFFEVSIAQILTLLVAIVIAFWATQRKTDERRIKEQIEKVVIKIQTEVSASSFVTFSSDDTSEEVQKRITMTTRKLKNAIEILHAYSKLFDIAKDVSYIEEQLREYDDCVSVKVGDLDYLSKSESHLRMFAENINSKCDHIILQLYTKL